MTFQQYFLEQSKYSIKYGKKAIVFFEMGKFYDAYCDETRGYQEFPKLETLLNIQFIRRGEKSSKNPHNKPSQFGIPTVRIKKHLATLVENGYTIIIFDQTANSGGKIVRECTGIYSPGTHISDRLHQDANYIMTAYIIEGESIRTRSVLTAIGVALVDITTGACIVHDFSSTTRDIDFALDELTRIIQSFRPVETELYYHPCCADNDPQDVWNYLNVQQINNVKTYVWHDKQASSAKLLNANTFKLGYQNKYLQQIYNISSKRNSIEYLNLCKMPSAVISLIIMMEFITEHNPILLRNLAKPEIYIYTNYLILGNNAIGQLNVIDANSLETPDGRIKSLFDVVNKTSTPMGRRFLQDSLANPLSQQNKKIIQSRYNIIQALLQDSKYHLYHEKLKNIQDVERLHRKMALGQISPGEFYRLHGYYKNISEIIDMAANMRIISKISEKNIIKNFAEYQQEYLQEFEMKKMCDVTKFNDIQVSCFKAGYYPKIDAIQAKIDLAWMSMNAVEAYFTKIICQKNSKFAAKNSKFATKKVVEIEINDREGYYFTTTKSNEKVLRQTISASQYHDIILEDATTIKLNATDIEFKQLPKGRTKIFITSMLNDTKNLIACNQKMIRMIKRTFTESMKYRYEYYSKLLRQTSCFVASIDFLVSGAIVAQKYAYCKPTINVKSAAPSYIKTQQLRHAIIERLHDKTEFIPNDIEIGNVPDCATNNGVLLYGLNSCGKSTLMKSIGIAVILAQMGYYVPAQTFEYEPYMSIFARITGNDNIFKGLSSFALEMTELDAILKRTSHQGDRTLVIGDEVCRGTEDTSGIALVASAIMSLSECNSTFIFSTHLHDLPDIPEIKRLANLRLFHLRVDHNAETKKLVFDRILTPGSGPRVYGLAVAKHLVKNQVFLDRAEIIKSRIMGEYIKPVTEKTSNYNSRLVVKKCAICDYSPSGENSKELETHHITFQKDCIDGKLKSKQYLEKNALYNLVVLCRKCHQKVHSNKIVVNGYKDTSDGVILNFYHRKSTVLSY